MKRTAMALALVILLLLAGVALANGSTAPPPVLSSVEGLSTGYDLSWRVIGGGGGHAEAGNYALDGTIGQAVAEVVSNGGYTLCSGFWCGAAVAAMEYNIYLPMVLKNYQ